MSLEPNRYGETGPFRFNEQLDSYEFYVFHKNTWNMFRGSNFDLVFELANRKAPTKFGFDRREELKGLKQ